ncbi:MAG: membrane protein insertase YidC [Flavobacteriaceae bacterium]
MEEKRFDPYQFIGFILISLILTWMLYRNQPSADQPQPAATEAVQATPEQPQATPTTPAEQTEALNTIYGPFAGFMQPTDSATQVLENDVLRIEVNPQGGILEQVALKDVVNYKDEPLYLVAADNSRFSIELPLKDGRVLQSEDFYFTPSLQTQGDTTTLVMTASTAGGQQLIFTYQLGGQGHLLDFCVATVGMTPYLDTEKKPQMHWATDAFRNSKSIEYENRYTELTYGHSDDKVDYLSLAGDDEETENAVRWISFRQHFFSAILVLKQTADAVVLKSQDLSEKEALEERFTKRYETAVPLVWNGGELNAAMEFYYGPTDYKTLKSYERNLEDSIPLGWGIFGWINRFLFLPLFAFLASFLPHGIAIIVLTIIVRLAMSPVTYKSYVSQIKMKVLRPEVDEINKKYANDAVKKQQEVMSLYTRAGANPMSGCVPALLQMPVFFALFTFFPVAYSLRNQPFLWADDLSSYDSVVDLPFSIPFYGDHISLFPILASIAIFFYTRMTTGQQPMPQQPGMPNMKVIMYLMPLMMLFFFNNYASGLSLYYFVSNLLTIILMLVIKNYIIDDQRIHAQIEENKKKPKKAGGFAARLQKAMEEAEKQKRVQGRK